MCATSRQSSLHDIITLAEIQSLAEAKTFVRGKAYFHEGSGRNTFSFEFGWLACPIQA
jgi:hypothetical protein